MVSKLASEPQRPLCGYCGLVEVRKTAGNVLLVARTTVLVGRQQLGAAEIACVVLRLRLHQVQIVAVAELEGQACAGANSVRQGRLRDRIPEPTCLRPDDERSGCRLHRGCRAVEV